MKTSDIALAYQRNPRRDLDAIIASSEAAIAITDADGRFIFANERFCDIAGRARSELLQLRLGDLPADDVIIAGPTIEVAAPTRSSAVPGAHPNAPVGGKLVIALERAARREKMRPGQSEQRLRAVIEAVEGVLWTANPDGEMEGEQPGWAELTGQAYDDYQGFGWVRALHSDDAEPTLKAWQSALAQEKAYVFEHRLRRKDGRWSLFCVRAVPTFDAGGRLCEWVGVHTDITDARTNEMALSDLTATLEHRVEAAIADRDRTWNNARDLLLVADPMGTIRAANPAWAAILGWDPEEVVGRRFADFIAGDDQSSGGGALAAMTGQEVKGHEIRMLHSNGFYRRISWVAAPGDGLIYANGRDVTAEREAAEAFEQSESRFRAIFQTSYQYKGIVALDGTVLDANPTSLRGIDASLAEVVGKPFWETPWFSATPGLPEKVRSALEAAAKGQTVRQEVLANLPAGPRCFDLTIRPIRDARGDVVAIVPEAQDITARRQAEEALRQSQKLEAIGQLTGGMAHDFNNLLTPIVGSLDLLQRKFKDDPQAVRLISGGLQSAERARLLVQRLLAFARRQRLEAQAIDLEHLVRGMLDLIGRSLGPQIQVRVDLAAGLPPARVDPNQLEVALINLTVNARDAMPDGGAITISTRTVDVGEGQSLAEGRYVCLSVADTGIGMTPETLARAVEPFFTTKAIGKGTGLGLSMVHGLAAQSGGQLTLESAPGKGTTATLWLPAADFARPPIPAAFEVESPPLALSVLLVDDDDLVRAGAAAMLEEAGHRVMQTHSATRALERLASGEVFDVLVTDQRMPCMTGVELIRRARSVQPGIAAVLITGYADSIDPSADSLPVLAKPFRAVELAKAVAEAVKGRQSQREANCATKPD